MHASIHCQLISFALFLPLCKTQLGVETVLLPRQVDRLQVLEQPITVSATTQGVYH